MQKIETDMHSSEDYQNANTLLVTAHKLIQSQSYQLALKSAKQALASVNKVTVGTQKQIEGLRIEIKETIQAIENIEKTSSYSPEH